MNLIPGEKSAFIAKAGGFDKVTQKMVRTRAEELAKLKGRYASDVTESNLAQARRDLTGKSDGNPGSDGNT
jgi:hypothetical protein